MKLLIDLGNSRIKWATLDHNGLSTHPPCDYGKAADHHQAHPPEGWSGLPEVDAIVLCSVASAATTRLVLKWCKQRWSCPIVPVKSQAAAHGIHNAYPQPQSLGADRWVAMIGAQHRIDGDKCIVDVGTAVTIDLLDASGHHQGGLIAPGYHAMLSALQHSTGLPIPVGPPPLQSGPGDNTADCIRTGALYGLTGLIRQSHSQFQRKLGASGDHPSRLIVTGGDTAALLPLLPSSTIHEPELLFHGLAVIAESAQ